MFYYFRHSQDKGVFADHIREQLLESVPYRKTRDALQDRELSESMIQKLSIHLN